MARLCSWSSREPPGWYGAYPAVPHVGSRAQPLGGVLNLPGCDPPSLVLPWMFPLTAANGELLLCSKRVRGVHPVGMFP